VTLIACELPDFMVNGRARTLRSLVKAQFPLELLPMGRVGL
jgi:hypothetical protein